MDSVNRAVFSLTYNESASKAYDEQNEKAAGAVEDLKKKIADYRKKRESLVANGEASEYFSKNSLSRITEWENWLEKNAGLAAGDYSKKETEMKTQWEGILNVNVVVKDMSRIPGFLDLFLKDKALTIPSAQKKDVQTLKSDAETYFKKILNETPADIVAKRDEFNRRFDEIQKKIPENFEDLKEPFTGDQSVTPPSLALGIQADRYSAYEQAIERREQADQTTVNFKRFQATVLDTFVGGFSVAWPWVFALIFAMIIANDAIGRHPMIRFFYFCAMFVQFKFSLIPGLQVFIFFYYIYRTYSAINWGNLFTNKGPWLDYLQAPVLFAFLPLIEGGDSDSLLWKIVAYFVRYDGNLYGGLAKKKKIAYEALCAKQVGQTLDPSSLGVTQESLDSLLCEMKSILAGSYDKQLKDLLEDLKKLV